MGTFATLSKGKRANVWGGMIRQVQVDMMTAKLYKTNLDEKSRVLSGSTIHEQVFCCVERTRMACVQIDASTSLHGSMS